MALLYDFEDASKAMGKIVSVMAGNAHAEQSPEEYKAARSKFLELREEILRRMQAGES